MAGKRPPVCGRRFPRFLHPPPQDALVKAQFCRYMADGFLPFFRQGCRLRFEFGRAYAPFRFFLYASLSPPSLADYLTLLDYLDQFSDSVGEEIDRSDMLDLSLAEFQEVMVLLGYIVVMLGFALTDTMPIDDGTTEKFIEVFTSYKFMAFVQRIADIWGIALGDWDNLDNWF